MDVVQPFIWCVAAIVGGAIALRVFFTLWRVVEKRLFPERYAAPPNAPHSVFPDLKGKRVIVHMKNGEVLKDHTYRKNFYFGSGEFDSFCTIVYFELIDPEGRHLYIAAADIWKLEAALSA